MRYLSAISKKRLRGAQVLLRVDFNIENRREVFRLDAAIPSIRFLLAQRARVILMSHRGRPQGFSKEESLRIVLPYLKKQLGASTTLLPDFDFKTIRKRVAHPAHSALFLLENLRFLPGEKRGSPALARELAALGDLYVNDAFSVCHRRNASVTELPKLLPSYAGLRLEQEIQNLSRAKAHARRPLILILGGVKVSDKLGVLRAFSDRADAFLVGGACANTFLKARGSEIGSSVYEPKMVAAARRLLRTKKIVLPADFVSHRNRFLDVGPLTLRRFGDWIRRARTIIWNGPMGYFEEKQFRHGSYSIAQMIAKSRAFSVVGGGETTELITLLRLQSRFSFVSTGGGAMLAFLAGENLPGLAALHYYR